MNATPFDCPRCNSASTIHNEEFGDFVSGDEESIISERSFNSSKKHFDWGKAKVVYMLPDKSVVEEAEAELSDIALIPATSASQQMNPNITLHQSLTSVTVNETSVEESVIVERNTTTAMTLIESIPATRQLERSKYFDKKIHGPEKEKKQGRKLKEESQSSQAQISCEIPLVAPMKKNKTKKVKRQGQHMERLPGIPAHISFCSDLSADGDCGSFDRLRSALLECEAFDKETKRLTQKTERGHGRQINVESEIVHFSTKQVRGECQVELNDSTSRAPLLPSNTRLAKLNQSSVGNREVLRTDKPSPTEVDDHPSMYYGHTVDSMLRSSASQTFYSVAPSIPPIGVVSPNTISREFDMLVVERSSDREGLNTSNLETRATKQLPKYCGDTELRNRYMAEESRMAKGVTYAHGNRAIITSYGPTCKPITTTQFELIASPFGETIDSTKKFLRDQEQGLTRTAANGKDCDLVPTMVEFRSFWPKEGKLPHDYMNDVHTDPPLSHSLRVKNFDREKVLRQHSIGRLAYRVDAPRRMSRPIEAQEAVESVDASFSGQATMTKCYPQPKQVKYPQQRPRCVSSGVFANNTEPQHDWSSNTEHGRVKSMVARYPLQSENKPSMRMHHPPAHLVSLMAPSRSTYPLILDDSSAASKSDTQLSEGVLMKVVKKEQLRRRIRAEHLVSSVAAAPKQGNLLSKKGKLCRKRFTEKQYARIPDQASIAKTLDKGQLNLSSPRSEEKPSLLSLDDDATHQIKHRTGLKGRFPFFSSR